MADVARTGSYSLTQSTNTSNSISLTVPTDADLCIVAVTGNGGGASNNNNFFDELCWDNGNTMDFTHIGSGHWSSNSWRQVQTWYMDSADSNWPGSGSKTLYYGVPGTCEEGYNVYVVFYKNVDTADPIGDTDFDTYAAGDYSGSFTGVGSSDMAFAVGYAYQGSALDGAPSGSGQTEIHSTSSMYNGAYGCICEELGASAITIDSSASNMVGGGFIINASTAITKTPSDTGSGTDALDALTATLDKSDTGSGSDSQSIDATLSKADSGSGSDEATVTPTSSLNPSDSGTGADSITVTATLTQADTGSGADALGGLTAPVSQSDTGSGADSVTVTATLTQADTGTGLDAQSVSSTESKNPQETGSGADALAGLEAALTISDSGSGADAVTTLTATLTHTDTGSGVDAQDIDKDTGSKQEQDSGTGADSVSIAVSLSKSDVGSGSESIAAAASFTVLQPASGADSIAAVIINTQESGSGADALAQVTAAVSPSETGSGADSHAISAIFAKSDSGSAIEVASAWELGFEFPFETETERDMFFDDYGITATVGGADITGLFTDGNQASLDISGSAPNFLCTTDDADTVGLTHGSTITIPAKGTYKVAKPPEPDGTGMVFFELTKIA